MSRPNPFAYRKPITLETLDDLFAHHRSQTGGWSMTVTPPENTPPERPEGIAEDEWNALGDPGKAALVREREARTKAERELVAARAKPTPKTPAPPAATPPEPSAPAGGDQQPDIAAIVKQAVDAAIKPFQERDQQRSAEEAAGKVRDAVVTAAKDRLHDASDAVANIDLTVVVNEQGQADPEKVKAALDDLIKRKPHLAKSTTRLAPPGIGGGGGGLVGSSEADRVKAVLADMQKSAGVRLPTS